MTERQDPELYPWFANQQSAENPRPPEIVIYPRLRCPNCNGTETKVTSTQKPIRHHKCLMCGQCFKTVEIPD